jgi:hypothetical protein
MLCKACVVCMQVRDVCVNGFHGRVCICEHTHTYTQSHKYTYTHPRHQRCVLKETFLLLAFLFFSLCSRICVCGHENVLAWVHVCGLNAHTEQKSSTQSTCRTRRSRCSFICRSRSACSCSFRLCSACSTLPCAIKERASAVCKILLRICIPTTVTCKSTREPAQTRRARGGYHREQARAR